MLRFSLIFVFAWTAIAGYTSWSVKHLQAVLGPIPFGDPLGASYTTPVLPFDRYNFELLVHYSDVKGLDRSDQLSFRQSIRGLGTDQILIRIKLFDLEGRELSSYEGHLSRWALSSARGFEVAASFWGERDLDKRVGFRAWPFSQYEVWASLEGNHPLLEQVPIEMAMRGRRDDGYYVVIWGGLLRGAAGVYILVLLTYLVRRFWAWMEKRSDA